MQKKLEFGNGWGGRREGAGRKPRGERPLVSHKTRPALAARHPVHVTVKLRGGLPTLRSRRSYAVLRRCFGECQGRAGALGSRFHLLQYSVQANHLHLVVEAGDRHCLARGMQGLLIRVARGLNKLWRRSGRVVADRYHGRALRTPREVRNALRYVLLNGQKHGSVAVGEADAYSSADSFDGWRGSRWRVTPTTLLADPVARAATWLLRKGWRRHGLIPLRL